VITGTGDTSAQTIYEPAHQAWQPRLYERLRGNAYPLFVFGERIVPAAAIWAGARLWTAAFRDAGLVPGDRLALIVPPSAAFVQILVAALWEGLTIAPFPASEDMAEALLAADARLAIVPEDSPALPGAWRAGQVDGPSATGALRSPRHAPSPNVRFLLRTSGTTGGGGRWIALGDTGVLSVLDSHRPLLGILEEQTHVLSSLPWHHAFGLLLDLLPALFSGAEIQRAGEGGRNIPALLDLADEAGTTYFSAVPLTIRRLAETGRGQQFLRGLSGGVVGGAPVDENLAEFLSQTNLRVGYGQTEASPGITLGRPGVWPGAGYLGTPLGCDTRIDPVRSELFFQGPNVCTGLWKPDLGLIPLPPGRWAATGDIVRRDGVTGDLFFQGRVDDAFKLTNGRRIEAGVLEATVKAACGFKEALLHSPDGEYLEIRFTPPTGGPLPDKESIAAAMGSAGKMLTAAQAVPSAFWSYTPKGVLDRRAVLATLAADAPAAEPTLYIGPDVTLTCETIETAALLTRPAAILSDNAVTAMDSGVEHLRRLREVGTPIYGTTTGFGPHVRYGSNGGGASHGASLLAHLGAGFGPEAPAPVVRAAMMIRAQSLSQGYSGLRPALLQRYLRTLALGITPCVPEIGSVGASGDLIPLSHMARAALCGEGNVTVDDGTARIAAAAALQNAGLTIEPLEGRDALAFANGTSFLTAYAALATSRGERLLLRAEALTGWMYRLLGARASALDDRLHAARGHAGQRESARSISDEANRCGSPGTWEDTARPLQEIYSLRCAPQVLGACRENLAHARRLIETEINGVSDNPLLVGDSDTACGAAALHGGNFQGQQVAFAADALNAALVQVGVLAERQIDALVTPGITNNHAPLLLAWEPGVTSGLAGAQITATALVAEMRAHCQAYGTFSIPTNGGNQDVVSMGTLAARMAYGQTERLAAILAILSMALVQLNLLRARGLATGQTTVPPPWMPPFAGLEGSDRPLWEDTERIAAVFLNG
jgi:histidine ammonia-lyase/tyrosine ammonia-lyase